MRGDLLETDLVGALVSVALLGVCIAVGLVVQRIADAKWRSRQDGRDRRMAPRSPSRRQPDALTPCDYCGETEGELLFNGWWKGDGMDEGLHIGDPVPLVLCRHCWEQADAAIAARLECKVLAR